ncbi:hypothetical protein GCM10009430_32610 [Aquimarina litoralis]|uniref:Uncharacterized protein n=1 Tax=Aquimarina litoralis TaxID=584605 RepID=A0ABP3U7A5_9FLAO
MGEYTPLEDPKTDKKDRQCRIKAKILTDHKANGQGYTVKESLN